MYTAKELSEKLINDGFTDMTVRKINYYAFEKKMFPVTGTGKSVFSDADYDKLKSIAFLRENSKHSLEEIKEKIEQHTFQELDNMLLSKTIGDYTSRNSTTLNNVFVDTPENRANYDLSFTTTSVSTTPSQAVSQDSLSVSSCTTDKFSSSNCYSTESYSTGTPPNFLRNTPNQSIPDLGLLPQFPSFVTETHSEPEETKTLTGKTRIKIRKGIFIEYTENADIEQVKKIVEISKIIF